MSRRWGKPMAVAAALLLAGGIAACSATTTVVVCSGKKCPVQVASRHDDQICGPAGCQWYYWLYFSNGLFRGVPYSIWDQYPPGAYYGTAGSLYAAAGSTVFVQLSEQQEHADDNADDDSDSYSGQVQSTATAVDDAEAAEADDDADSGDDDVTSDEGYESPVSYSDDDDSFGDDG